MKSPYPATPARLFVGLLLLCISALVSSAQNFVKNSSFQGDLTSWGWALNGGGAGTCAPDSSTKHWEEKSARITYASTLAANRYGSLSQQITGLTVGQTYYIYVWCKGSSVGGSTQIATGQSWQFRKTIPAGTYDWTLVEHSFTADATSVPLVILLQNPTTALWVDDIYFTRNQRKNVTTLGIPGNDTDVTSALSSALSTYKFLYFPAGTYRISSAITFPKEVILWGDGSGSVIKSVGSGNYLFSSIAASTTTPVGDSEFSALNFTGARTQTAVYVKLASNFLVRHCTTNYVALLETYNLKAYNLVTSEADLNKNIRVAFNTLTSSDATASNTALTGIRLGFTIDSEAYKNNISYFKHGISWWGGDADYVVDGAPANPRWARRINITGNTVAHMSWGGIWGSMGENITVKQNNVSDCGDNCIDFEGSVDCTAELNTVSDGVSGCLTAYFGCTNVVFSNNIVTVNNPAWPLYLTQNSSSSPNRITQTVILKDNTFVCTSGIGFIENGSGPVSLTMNDNTLSNIAFDWSSNGTGWDVYGPRLKGNSFDISQDTGSALNVVNIYYSASNVSLVSNQIKYTGVTKSNKKGIAVKRSNAGSSAITLSENSVEGCSQSDIYVQADGPSTVSASINSNTVEFSKIHAKQQNAGQLTVSGSGNQNLSGTSVPVTWLPY